MSFNPYPWSYSSLGLFEQCPYRFHQTRVEKIIPKSESIYAIEGKTIHKEIEEHYKSGAPYETVPDDYKSLVSDEVEEPDITESHFELELAVTKDLELTGYWDNDAWYRCVIDLCQYSPNTKTVFVKDWKTGKPDIYSRQLIANSLCAFAKYPEATKAKTKYIWLKYGSRTPGCVHREYSRSIADSFQDRVNKIEQALDSNQWPKNPSGLCKKYCDVYHCEHNGLGSGKEK